MIGFWISAGAMVLMVGIVLTQALRQGGSATLLAGGAQDLAVYRDQLAEVDRDLARGTLAPAEAERLRLEVQRRMLDADRMLRGEAAPPPSRSFPLALGAVVLALAGAGALYWRLGVPGYPDLPLSLRLSAADDAYQHRPTQDQAEAGRPAFTPPANADPAMLAMMDKLRAAVATRPDDLQGHTLLARSEASLGNYVAARKAQEVVVQLRGSAASGDDLAFLANLMVNAAGGLVTPEAEKVLVRCLQVDPTNGWARFYSGLMFAEILRPDRAFGLWQPLVAEGPADAPWLPMIRSQIEDVAAAAGVNYTLPNAAPGPDAATVAAASQMSEADRNAMIKTMVGGLEQRLLNGGGPAEDWSRLITSLGVLHETDRARAAYAKAQAAYAGKPGDLAALHAAAVQAGVAQ